MGWLREAWRAVGGYRSVLLWRFDLVPFEAMGGSVSSDTLKASPLDAKECDPSIDAAPTWATSHRNFQCWCYPLDSCSTTDGWAGYAAAHEAAYFRYEDDWGHSFPGWLARCAIPVFESDCLAMPHRNLASHDCWVRLARTFRVLTTHPRKWAVYREDFRPNPGGGPVCPLLRDRFGGAPCPDAAHDGKWAACHNFARAARLGPENATQDFGFSKLLHCDGEHINFANLPRWHANFQATMLSRNATYAAHHRHDRARRPPS